jgi:peptide chain release factor 1
LLHNEKSNHKTKARSRSTVSVLTQDKIETVYDKRSDGDFSYRWFSGTGKGGQHRNRHMCCLELTHIPSGLTQIANGRSRETNAQQALRDINQKLDDIQKGETRNDTNQVRVNQIGSGTRGDRRRTYRFGEDKIIDHLTGKQTSCKMFMRGDIERLW